MAQGLNAAQKAKKWDRGITSKKVGLSNHLCFTRSKSNRKILHRRARQARKRDLQERVAEVREAREEERQVADIIELMGLVMELNHPSKERDGRGFEELL